MGGVPGAVHSAGSHPAAGITVLPQLAGPPKVIKCKLIAVRITGGSDVHQVLFGTVLLVSFLGGVVALLAPCCVSVMLPAYLATGFGRRSGIAAATGVFAAGVATLIAPIGLGASALSAALPAHHRLIFSIGGAAMLAGGVAVLAGWKPMLPMPSLRS